MVKQFSMELAGRTLTVEIGKVAAQANGAALMRYGDTAVSYTHLEDVMNNIPLQEVKNRIHNNI